MIFSVPGGPLGPGTTLLRALSTLVCDLSAMIAARVGAVSDCAGRRHGRDVSCRRLHHCVRRRAGLAAGLTLSRRRAEESAESAESVGLCRTSGTSLTAPTYFS